jgi:hypothetical protein
MLCQMHFFNDASQKLDKSFILNGKALEVGKIERERKRNRKSEGKVWEEKGWGVGHKLGRCECIEKV